MSPAGVTILVVAVFFLIKRLRSRGYRISSLPLRLPFSRPDSDKDSAVSTTNTAWPSPWNGNLWGSVSNGPLSTISGFRSKKSRVDNKTNSEILDELVQASYAAEDGNNNFVLPAEKARHRRSSDLESQSPPSPGTFLDENFLNEKSYAKLEGPWPFNSSSPAATRVKKNPLPPPKTPGLVARWLDGILTPRQSVVAVPPVLVPGGGQMSTKWQPEPPLPVAGGGQASGVLKSPAPAFAKGAKRDTRMTETTTTVSSSIVW